MTPKHQGIETNSTTTSNNIDFHEETPLVSSQEEGGRTTANQDSSCKSTSKGKGSATVVETIINLCKACMGTGCLVLPFAAREGGILLYVFGTIAIALWNTFSTKRLCQCLDLIQNNATNGCISNQQHNDSTETTILSASNDSGNFRSKYNLCCKPEHSLPMTNCSQSITRREPPQGTATLGKVAWYALGPTGLFVMDIMITLFLLGVIVAYQDAVKSFLMDTPFHTSTGWIDGIIVALIMATLSIVPDMGYLVKASATGLFVLGFVFTVVTIYGILQRFVGDYDSVSIWASFHWLPRNGLEGASNWFGCTVFGFGVVPLTFNFQESMAEPQKLVQATTIALISVAITYIGVGLGLLMLYPEIEGDVLHELTQVGIIPVMTRLAIVIVVIVTTPLLVLPCSELVRGKLYLSGSRATNSSNSTIAATDIDQQESIFDPRTIVPFVICLSSAAISIAVPGFVSVLSFVGCFSVAFVSFIIPPFFHFMLLLQKNLATPVSTMPLMIEMCLDVTMLILGIISTVVSTTLVLRAVAT